MIKPGIAIGMNGSMLDEQPTGVGVYTINLVNNLSRIYREQITVFTPSRFQLHADLRVVKLPGLLQSSKYGKLAAISRFLWNTFYYPFQARRFDLLISPTTHGSFTLPNQVITIHDLLSLRYKNISAHQRFYFKYLLPFLISRAKVVVAVSETTKQEIIHFLKCPPEKIAVIYNGYDQQRYFATNETTNHIREKYGIQDYLLAVGPTYPHKNFETLIDAYASLDQTTRDKHPLLIAGGKKKYLDHLKQYVQGRQLNQQIHFTGYVPSELMAPLYREAHALVFPSLYEGFGFPLLEAMACGCPVISSNTSSMPEVCGEAALYFTPTNRKEMSLSIEKLVFDNKLRQDLREKGLVRAKQFSWEQTAQALKTLIDRLH